jgi:hypothetical protein
MASVIRLNPGGSTTLERIGLTLEQAQELAARFREADEPPGCAWCVGLDEEEEEAGRLEAFPITQGPSLRCINGP